MMWYKIYVKFSHEVKYQLLEPGKPTISKSRRKISTIIFSINYMELSIFPKQEIDNIAIQLLQKLYY